MDTDKIAVEPEEKAQAVIILTGNIGTGKTTVAEFLIANFTGDSIIVVSNDAITSMTGNGNYQRYNPMLSKMYKNMSMSCLKAGIDSGATVILDNSHMSRVSRREAIKVANEAGVPVTSIDLGPGSPESLKRRQDALDDRNTSNTVWCLVHNRFRKQYETPKMDEGILTCVTADQIREIM